MKLHGYFRSGASYRTRIALNLKGVQTEHVFHHLQRGEQLSPDYLRLNPQGLVPALELDDGAVLTQSLAIIEWLEETYPAPALLPLEPLRRAQVRAFAYSVAIDIHPIQNLRVLKQVRDLVGTPEAGDDWARGINERGLRACEALIRDEPGPYCFGAAPTLADVCLIPQMASARRFGADLGGLTRLLAIEDACSRLEAFAAAAPARQPDAE